MTANTAATRKAKGRKLQQDIVKLIKETFSFLHEEDIISAPMGTNGEDIILSHEAAEWFPFSVEAKNTERLDIWKALAQAEAETRARTPVVIFKRNRTSPYLVISFKQFLLILDTLRNALEAIATRTGTQTQTIESALTKGVKP